MKRNLGGLLVGILILLIGAAGTVSAKQDKVYVCHAAGRDGTTQYVTLHVPATDTGFPQGHFTEDGTPEAGHEDDYLGQCQPEVTPSPTPTSTSTSTPSPTPSASPTATPTPSATPTSTPTMSPSLTPEPSPSSTSSPSSIPTLPPTDTASGSQAGPGGWLLALGIILAIAGFSLGYAGYRSRIR